MDADANAEEEEEKRRLISQVLELQNTLDGMFRCIFQTVKCIHSCFAVACEQFVICVQCMYICTRHFIGEHATYLIAVTQPQIVIYTVYYTV